MQGWVARWCKRDAKRIFGVLGLDAGQGDTVVVTCEGSDEHEARMTLEQLAQEL